MFPSCSERGVILSQIANWEDYGITISSPCLTTGSVEEVFDKTIMPSFSCELASTNDTSRSSVERNSVLYVFLFIDAVVESTNVIPTHPTSNQLCMYTITAYSEYSAACSVILLWWKAFNNNLLMT